MLSPTNENGDIEKSTVAVAIDKDKGSQQAFKWAIENVLNPGEGISLIHVKQQFSVAPTPNRNSFNKAGSPKLNEEISRELFRPFHVFCTRKHIKCREFLLEDNDVKTAIVECVNANMFETLVLSASTKTGLMKNTIYRRLWGNTDIPTAVMKSAPDFTTVCVVSKGKVVAMKSATDNPPTDRVNQQQTSPTLTHTSSYSDAYSSSGTSRASSVSSYNTPHEEFFRSPFTRGKSANGTAYGEVSAPEFDISFVGSQPEERMLPLDSFGSEHSDGSLSMSELDHLDFGSPFKSSPRTSTELRQIPGSS